MRDESSPKRNDADLLEKTLESDTAPATSHSLWMCLSAIVIVLFLAKLPMAKTQNMADAEDANARAAAAAAYALDRGDVFEEEGKPACECQSTTPTTSPC